MVDAVIPRFRAERAVVPGTYDPTRRPGSSGQRYFSDMRYANPNMSQRIFDKEAEGYETQADYDARYDTAMDAAIDAARVANTKQATGLQALNLANLARGTRPTSTSTATAASTQVPYFQPSGTETDYGVNSLYNLLADYIKGTKLQPYPIEEVEEITTMAQGGLASIAPQGMYLGGATDGMADNIPATINNNQPAALSDGEFVIPADVVSHLGNGNSNAGAKQLYGMMDKIRKARTGDTKQGRQIDANKFLA